MAGLAGLTHGGFTTPFRLKDQSRSEACSSVRHSPVARLPGSKIPKSRGRAPPDQGNLPLIVGQYLSRAATRDGPAAIRLCPGRTRGSELAARRMLRNTSGRHRKFLGPLPVDLPDSCIERVPPKKAERGKSMGDRCSHGSVP